MQDERFSYVVLRRGPRPAGATPSAAVPATGAVPEASVSAEEPATLGAPEEENEDADDSELEPDAAEPPASAAAVAAAVAAAARGWARIVRAPRKRSGHVVLDLCTPAGTLERRVMAASHASLLGPSSYRLARKARWGDAWPHPAVLRRTRIAEDGQWVTALEIDDLALRSKVDHDALGERHLE